jgi:hypothetical protein
MHFGHDGGGGNRMAARISLDERPLRNTQVEGDGVDEHKIGRRLEARHRGPHGDAAGLINVEKIDGRRVYGCNRPGYRALADAGVENFPPFGVELFAVVQPANRPFGGEDHSGGDYRPEECSAPDFVNAGDSMEAAGAYFALDCAFAPEFATRGFGSHGRKNARLLFALSETSGFALQITEIVQLGATYAAGPDHIDVIDHARVQGENAFYALAERDLADRHRSAHPGIVAGDNSAFEGLEPFLIAFLNFDVNADRVTRTKGREVGPHILLNKLGQQRVLHGMSLNFL